MLRHLEGHNEEIESRIFESYRNIRRKSICLSCDSVQRVNANRPVAFFVVGEDFPNEKHRIMFVGKTTRGGWEGDPIDAQSGFIDPRKYAKEELFLPFWSTTPFWMCIKEMCQVLWKTTNPAELWKKIAVTNLVKCSTSQNLDTTPEVLKMTCIVNARFFEKEVMDAQPTHIILFTGSGYDKYLEKLTFGYDFRDGQKRNVNGIDLWQRTFSEKERIRMYWLRTYHPDYFRFKSMDDKRIFCRNLAKWIGLNPVLS